MAARLNKRQAASVVKNIQVSRLVGRLHKHVDGEIDMSRTQVDAAKYLISQAIGTPPASVALTDDEGGPLKIETTVKLVRPSAED